MGEPSADSTPFRDRSDSPISTKEGMLVEDFNLMGTMSTLYNYSYYPVHMDRLGFTKAADWLQPAPPPPARHSLLSATSRRQKADKPTLPSETKHTLTPRFSTKDGDTRCSSFQHRLCPLFGFFTNISEAQIRDCHQSIFRSPTPSHGARRNQQKRGVRLYARQ